MTEMSLQKKGYLVMSSILMQILQKCRSLKNKIVALTMRSVM